MRFYAAVLSRNPAHRSIIETATFDDAKALVAAANSRLSLAGSSNFATVLSENGRNIMNVGRWPEVHLIEVGPIHEVTYGGPFTRAYNPEINLSAIAP